MGREQKIRILSAILLAGFVIAILWHYMMKVWLGQGSEMGTFLFRPEDRFMDFFNLVEHNRDLQPYTDRTSIFGVYFPLGEIFFYPFSRTASAEIGLCVFLGIFFCAWTAMIVQYFSQVGGKNNLRDLVTIGFLNYPLLFAVDRSNVELYIFLAVCGFFFFYGHKDPVLSFVGLFCLSLAISMKPFPVLFLAVLGAEKKWKDLMLAVLMTAGICILALLCFKDGFFENIQGLRANQAKFFEENMLGDAGWAFGSSLFGCLKIFIRCVTDGLLSVNLISDGEHHKTFAIITQFTAKLYSLAALMGIAWAAWYVNVTNCARWKKIAILTFLMVMLPFASGDYRLLYLFIPLIFFVNTKERSAYDPVYVVLFGLLLVPKNYYVIPLSLSDRLGLGVLLNPLLMLAFIAFIIKDNLSKARVSL